MMMGFRIRKSINLGGGVRVNLSKKGVGMSVGVKGARVGVGPRGVRTTASIAGTGISFVKEHRIGASRSIKGSSSKYQGPNPSQDSVSSVFGAQQAKGTKWGIGVLIGLILSFSIPYVGIPLLLLSIYLAFKSTQAPENKSITNYNLAVKELKKNNTDKAIEFLQQAVQENSENIQAQFALAMLLHDIKNDYQNAVVFAEKILSYTDNAMLQEYILGTKFILADSYYELRRYDDAIRLMQSIHDELPEEIEYERLLLIGRSFFEKGQYEMAVEQFKKGPILKRTMTKYVMEFRYWLGITYIRLGDKRKAKTQLAKVYAEDINYRDIESYIGEFRLETDNGRK